MTVTIRMAKYEKSLIDKMSSIAGRPPDAVDGSFGGSGAKASVEFRFGHDSTSAEKLHRALAAEFPAVLEDHH